MQPIYELTPAEHDEILHVLKAVPGNPYLDYPGFARALDQVTAPAFFREVCTGIRKERESGVSDAHMLRNCPIDEHIPELSGEDPLGDKYAKKQTFVGEAFLALLAKLSGTPLMCYGSRNNGDFFTDVVANTRYRGQKTGYSDSELPFHNDRTAHWARADFISLLGMRCPDDEVIYTTFVSGRALLAHLSPQVEEVLRKPYFHTPFDVYSRNTNSRQRESEDHPILENERSIRYLDTTTTVTDGAPTEAKDALIALKDALVMADKKRHRMRVGDLLVFANQDGLHSRDLIEIIDRDRAATRWLLKTYAFRDSATADRYAAHWKDGVPGRIDD
ncbi:MAG TPA: TauD/TfdA family dioxygenase [Jatrophihabitans sp.]|jgi:hypothetical protein|uniref:TauD/TfdA family dioxygenase n=1 Tax=Jatrophihabitans sp. TaxID=1932789 RepID=UPI002F10DAAB